MFYAVDSRYKAGIVRNGVVPFVTTNYLYVSFFLRLGSLTHSVITFSFFRITFVVGGAAELGPLMAVLRS